MIYDQNIHLYHDVFVANPKCVFVRVQTHPLHLKIPGHRGILGVGDGGIRINPVFGLKNYPVKSLFFFSAFIRKKKCSLWKAIKERSSCSISDQSQVDEWMQRSVCWWCECDCLGGRTAYSLYIICTCLRLRTHALLCLIKFVGPSLQYSDALAERVDGPQ